MLVHEQIIKHFYNESLKNLPRDRKVYIEGLDKATGVFVVKMHQYDSRFYVIEEYDEARYLLFTMVYGDIFGIFNAINADDRMPNFTSFLNKLHYSKLQLDYLERIIEQE